MNSDASGCVQTYNSTALKKNARVCVGTVARKKRLNTNETNLKARQTWGGILQLWKDITSSVICSSVSPLASWTVELAHYLPLLHILLPGYVFQCAISQHSVLPDVVRLPCFFFCQSLLEGFIIETNQGALFILSVSTVFV